MSERRRPPRPRPRRAPAAALVAVALVLVGCGVPLDDEPRAITRVTQPVETTPQTVDSPTGQAVTVYFLNEGALEPARFSVEDEPTVDEALRFLLTSPPPDGLQQRIPTGTTLRGVVRNGNQVTIDLSAEINDIGSPNQKEAFAQLVFTALELPGIDRVSFSIQGEPVKAPTDNANLDVVTAADYDPPLNPR